MGAESLLYSTPVPSTYHYCRLVDLFPSITAHHYHTITHPIMSLVSTTFINELAESCGGPGYSVIPVDGIYHPGVTITWTDGPGFPPEVQFADGEASRKASAVLIVNPEGYIDPKTTILGETGTEADSVKLLGNDYVESVSPRAGGYIGFDGKVSRVAGVDVFEGKGAFEWEATWVDPEDRLRLSIPSLPCWSSQAEGVLDLDKRYGESSDDSAQEEAEGI